MPIWLKMYVSMWIIVPILGGILNKTFWIIGGGFMFKCPLKWDVRLRTIGMSFALGFAAEMIAVMYLGIVMILFPHVGIQSNAPSLTRQIILFSAILLNMLINGFMQFYLLKRVAIQRISARRLAILISLFTAPWLFIFAKL